MCEHAAKRQFLIQYSKDPLAAPSARQGSRRRRLWDLSTDCHCPVIGVCLPIGLLRKAVNKALGNKAIVEDYELHVGAVNECRSRNRVSEVLQRALEQRHALVVGKFKSAKSTEEVRLRWQKAVLQGDVSGALWAALTHGCCDARLEEQICREIHMIQHQTGARVQADLGAMETLIKENASLLQELGGLQERTTRMLAEKNAEVEALNADLMNMRSNLIAQAARIDSLQAELSSTRAVVPALDTRERLTEMISRLQARISEQEHRIAELQQESAAKKNEKSDDDAHSTFAGIVPHDAHISPVTVDLARKTVLCVGGRSACIPKYRRIVQQYGGAYMHHDGGLEENMRSLAAGIAAADLVICQTGCISHDAYWRVKDQCKRTGKQCIYVENPSPSSLTRTLSRALQQTAPELVFEDSAIEHRPDK